jgi:tetratricopeptide (TPR) repeat protein
MTSPSPDRASPSLEAAVALTRRALDEGDVARAAAHLGEAILAGPTHADVDALSTLIASRLDPRELAPHSSSRLVASHAALRAFLLYRLGQRGAALVDLLRAHAASPDTGFAPIAVAWSLDSNTLAEVDPDDAASCLAARLGSARALRGIEPVMLSLQRAHPRHEGLMLWVVRLLRALGQRQEALALALDAAARFPSHAAWAAVSAARREQGDTAGAREAALAALTCAPDDIALRLDLGDMALACDDLPDAARWYREALEREPHEPWARASDRFLAWTCDGDAGARRELEALARQKNPRAKALYDALSPCEIDLVPPVSSFVDAARHARTTGYIPTRSSCSSYEPPSALAAARDILGLSPGARLTVELAEIPTPDPRLPRGPVDHTLWAFRKPGFFGRLRALVTVGHAAFPPPGPRVASAVAALAITPYDAEAWRLSAKETARSLDGRATIVDELLGAMVCSVPRPVHDNDEDDPTAEWDPATFRFRVIVAAAFLVAALDESWLGSRRRSALLALLFGPTDWTTTAAIVVLAAIARAEPAAREDIRARLAEARRVGGGPVELACVTRLLDAPAAALS